VTENDKVREKDKDNNDYHHHEEDGSFSSSSSSSFSSSSSPIISLMVIPQAGLVSSIKDSGKALNYHHQMQKEEGKKYYEKLQCIMKKLIAEELGLVDKTNNIKMKKDLIHDRDLPPSQMFRQGSLWIGKFSSFDNNGIPILDKNGNEISKGQKKKLIRLHAAAVKKYEKKITANTTTTTTITTTKTTNMNDTNKFHDGNQNDINQENENNGYHNHHNSTSTLEEEKKILEQSLKGDNKNSVNNTCTDIFEKDHDIDISKYVNLVFGTFGNRQGFRFASVAGPFTHMFQSF